MKKSVPKVSMEDPIVPKGSWKSPPVLTDAEIGLIIGIGVDDIEQLRAAGVLPEGKASVDRVVAAYCEHLRQLAAGQRGEVEIARARFLRAQAVERERRNQVAAGKLADVSEFYEMLAPVVRDIRQGLQRGGARMVPGIRAAATDREALAFFDAEMRRILCALSTVAQRGAKGAA